MKLRILYSSFLLLALCILFYNASGGAAAVQKADRTRSPLSNNSSCATCHNSGAYSPKLNVQLLDGDMAVTSYQAGKTYTLSVAITGAADADTYGFQTVLLYGEDDLNAGSFGTPATGMQLSELNEVTYAEHSSPSNDSTFTIEWTAPDSGVGDIRLYAGGNAANGNGSVSGDQGTFLSDPLILSEDALSSIQDRLLRFDAIQISPNPTQSGTMINIENSRPDRYALTVFNTVGKNIHRENLDLVQGSQSYWLDLSDQPKGIYFLQISNGQQLLTRKILKQ